MVKKSAPIKDHHLVHEEYCSKYQPDEDLLYMAKKTTAYNDLLMNENLTHVMITYQPSARSERKKQRASRTDRTNGVNKGFIIWLLVVFFIAFNELFSS